MAGGSVLLLTIVVVFSTWFDCALLQRPGYMKQNPFQLKTHFLSDFQLRENPPSFAINEPSSSVSMNRHRRTSPSNFTDQLLWLTKDGTGSNAVAKRRVLENPKVQNFLREKMRENFEQQKSQGHKDYLTTLINLTTINNDTFNPNTSDEEFININGSLVSTNIIDDSNIFTPTNSLAINTPSPKFERLSLGKSKMPKQMTSQLVDYNEERRKEEENENKISVWGYIINTLTRLPVIGNVLQTSVDPLYRPIIQTLQSEEAAKEHIMGGEENMKNWCFGILGCMKPSADFYHPIYRPINMPPYPREQIDTKFTFFSRKNTEGRVVSAMDIDFLNETLFLPNKPTKILIHGFFNNQKEAWILKMARALLKHGDYNVITVDWSRGSHALYSQATANTRVVALETVRLLRLLTATYSLEPSSVHIIGHSLGAHTAGYVGKNVEGIGRITGLDPAEPFFQYMPTTVRLDPSDANFVDVIHTDMNSFFSLTGPRGFGLQQAVGHIDFYPNGGREQPGCNQIMATLPMTLISTLTSEGANIIEGISAGQSELFNCDHIRSANLFTDSLLSDCPYLGFACPSYKSYKEGKCFRCGSNGENCASMGINADAWHRGNRSLVKVYLDTNLSPHFCKYHYLLTIYFNDPSFSAGTLRGKLKVSLITEDGNLRKFDLTSKSPLKFPRRGSRTFMLEHYENLSGSREALLNWTFESDLMDPFTFCVFFCNAGLSISSVTLTSIDTPKAAEKMIKLESKGLLLIDEIIMCHKKGDDVISIPSGSTVKVAASPSCPNHRIIKSKLHKS